MSEPFLSRWARRKADVRRIAEAQAPAPEPPSSSPATPSPVPPEVAGAGGSALSGRAVPAADRVDPAPQHLDPAPQHLDPAPAGGERLRLPTLDDVASLTRESDYAPFVQRGVDPAVKNAALRKLFSDPHFNVMDGLDTYIDDYGKPDPIEPSMLRRLNQAASLGLFDAAPDEPPAALAHDASAAVASRAAAATADVAAASAHDAPAPLPGETPGAPSTAPPATLAPPLAADHDHDTRATDASGRTLPPSPA